MSVFQAMNTSHECRKLASYYRTRESGGTLSEEEKVGLANLLTGVADLIQSLNVSNAPDKGNIITLAKQANR